jgi:hypothetical protein
MKSLSLMRARFFYNPLRCIVLAAILLVGLCQAISAQESFVFPIEGERARVSFVEGEVRRQRQTEGPWTTLTQGAFVQAGERLMAMKDARLELQLPDRSIIRFDERERGSPCQG